MREALAREYDMPTLHRFDDALRDLVAANMAAFDPRPAAAGGLRAAAVAVTIAGDDRGRACFVLTRRASGLRKHASQWALPGGGIDAGEQPADAARRELLEELGLTLDEPSVLGVLDDYPTRSGFVITPVVVWASVAPVLAPNPAEVEVAHLVPLDELEHPESPRFIDGADPERPVIQLPLYGRFVHAPTAAILYQLREVALHGRATRVAHFDQPEFAWR